MGFFSNLFGSFSPLPKPPMLPDMVRQIYLEEDDLRWTSFKNIDRALRGHATIAGRTIDLHGCCISGQSLRRSKNRDEEKALGITVEGVSFNLINGFISDIPGGIKVSAPNCRF